MHKPTLYRKRFIPNEKINLKDDEILFINDEVIVTKWKALKQRNDFTNGISVYFLKKGYKVSKFMNDLGELVYYYCDIIDTVYNEADNCYTFIDLLADVIIYENGFVKVLDLGEITDALDKGLIDIKITKKALKRVDELLEKIYTNKLLDTVKDYFKL